MKVLSTISEGDDDDIEGKEGDDIELVGR